MRSFVGGIARHSLRVFRNRPKRPALSLAELAGRYDLPRSGVLHVGANDGSEAVEYDRCGFTHVVWIEGFPDFYQALMRRLAAFPRQSAHNVLVSDVDGEEIEFRVADNAVSSTALPPAPTHFEEFPTVHFHRVVRLPARRLDTFFIENDEVDLADVKILVLDVQGSELKALASLGRYLHQIDFALVEISVGENFVGGPSLADIDRFLLASGFVRAEVRMGSSTGDAFYVRRSANLSDRARQWASAQFYSKGVYGLYRRKVVKWVKRLAGEQAPKDKTDADCM
jgi:FkbM family methyltransferase